MMLLQRPESSATDGRVYDFCVVGSGPAGITLAVELGAKGFTVLLLEAGPDSYSADSQDFYKGEVVGDRDFELDVVRLRSFGGTSNHWSGWCRPLDQIDFEQRVPGVHTAWPISRGDLDPYLSKAMEILELGSVPPDVPLDENLKQIWFSYSPPVRFGEKYGPDLAQSQNVVVVLNAYLVNFEERDGGVAAAEVRDPLNRPYRVRARNYVLCAGGIENSRILLWSNLQNHGRLIKDSRTLGKYWMDHPHFIVGEALVGANFSPGLDERSIAYFSPTSAAMRSERIMNCGLRFMPISHEGAKKLIADIACVAPSVVSSVTERLGKRPLCGGLIDASWEQAPREWNRITLGSDKDAFGVPRVEVHWKKSELELRTVRETMGFLGKYLASKDLGRIKLAPWVLGNGNYPATGGKIGPHHMGGTRMSREPRDGIVDANLKVHGLSNLYVCGSSVYPSAGHANPTLTIIQLTCRLAENLAAKRAA
jgi:choline dehydrogenase-like flavoprotein